MCGCTARAAGVPDQGRTVATEHRDQARAAGAVHPEPVRGEQAGPPLRGRAEELALLDRLVERTLSSCRAAVARISGPGGAGRSRLLREGELLAAARGFRIARLTAPPPAPLTAPGWTQSAWRSVPLGAAGPLAALVPVLARALEVRVPSGAEEWDEPQAGRALLGLLDGRLQQGPLLLSCDGGAGWPALLGQLVAARRGAPLLLLTTGHEGHPPGLRQWPGPGPGPGERSGPEDGQLLRLVLGPLSAVAVGQLCADLLGAPPDSGLAALLGLARGRPGEVFELLGALERDGALRPGADPLQLSAGAADGGPADGGPPRRLGELIARRLCAAPGRVRLLLEAAAVLGPASLPDEVAQMLDEPVSALVPVFREAARTGLAHCESEYLTFRHELVRSALLAGLPPAVRAAMHRQALAVQLAGGRSAVAVAPHLLHGAYRGDPVTGPLLRLAAAQSLARDPATAAELALRGLDVLGVGEGLDEGLGERLLAEPEAGAGPGAAGAPDAAGDGALAAAELSALAAEACVRSGALDRGRSLAEAALARPAVPVAAAARLRIALADALMLLDRPAGALALAERAAGDRGIPSTVRQEALLTQAAALAQGPGEPHRELARLLRRAHTQGLDLRAAVRLADGVLAWRAGRPEAALQLGQEAVALAAQGCATAWHTPAEPIRALLLVQAGCPDEAAAAIDPTAADGSASSGPAASSGPVAARRPVTVGPFVPELIRRIVLARLALAEGALQRADAEAHAALRLAERAATPHCAALARRVLATVAVHRGDHPAAVEHTAALRATAAAQRPVPPQTPAPGLGADPATAAAWFEAQLLAADGDLGPVGHALKELAADEAALGRLTLDEPACVPWLVRAALAAGEPERAAAVLAAVRRLAEANPAVPALRPAAEHARGLLEHDPRALAVAARDHRDAWARASAAEDLGVLLGPADRPRAVRSLGQALEAYQRLGAERDAARARRRLRALGVRRRHWTRAEPSPATGWASLTRTERTVAGHAAAGLTNRQIAARMFLSPHTVAFHLRQIFRKLGIHSRLELALRAPAE